MTTIQVPSAEDLFAVLGEHGERWMQGAYEGGGARCCLHGAIRRCSPQPGDAMLIEGVAARKGWGTEWNDDDDRTWSDVRDLIARGLEVTDDDLAETYGPQWREIVALVRRRATLTHEEVKRLAAAWDTARDAAMAATWDAAWDAARAVVWSAAMAATWDEDAAWDAARAAARDAAVALVVRDLIGHYGFTQTHYDELTGPWRRSIGPVHPDDGDLLEGER